MQLKFVELNYTTGPMLECFICHKIGEIAESVSQQMLSHSFEESWQRSSRCYVLYIHCFLTVTDNSTSQALLPPSHRRGQLDVAFFPFSFRFPWLCNECCLYSRTGDRVAHEADCTRTSWSLCCRQVNKWIKKKMLGSDKYPDIHEAGDMIEND